MTCEHLVAKNLFPVKSKSKDGFPVIIYRTLCDDCKKEHIIATSFEDEQNWLKLS